MRRTVVAAMLAAVLMLAARPGVAAQAAQAAEEEHYGRDAGYGVLAVVSNLLYMPVKIVYGGLGGLTGGLAYVLTAGNLDVAEAVWGPSLGGTYVITPGMLRGEEEFLFSGPSHEKK